MPDWKGEIGRFVEGLGLDPAREAQIVEELAQHAGDRWEELVAGGTSPADAHRTVSGEIGGGVLTAELRRTLKPAPSTYVPGPDEPGRFWSGFGRDLSHGARLLRRDLGFAAVAILSLGLGIGANTAIFQLIDAIRLRTLPVSEPERLAEMYVNDGEHGRTGGFTGRNPQLTYSLWQRLRDEQRVFSSVAAWSSEKLNVSPGGEVRFVEALWVSGGFFRTLDVAPAAGRLISPADDLPGCGSAGVVLGHSFWQREFAGNPSLASLKVTLEGHAFDVIGVAPRSFFGVEVGRDFDVALPLCAEPITTGEKPRILDAQAWWLSGIGRLKPGVTLEGAAAQLGAISRGIFKTTLPAGYDPTDAKDYLTFRFSARSGASGVSSLRRRYETPLWFLLAISGLVLLIACANLANLIMARSGTRQREMAVRLALGASRLRLARQLFAENLLLAAIGAVSGALLAQVLSRLLVSFLSTRGVTWSLDLKFDGRVLAFTAGLAMLTCFLFGLAPALQSASISLGEVMKSSGRGATAGRQRLWLRRGLVVSQIALSLVLLVGALLFVRTLRNLLDVDAGFRRDHILVAGIDYSPLSLPKEKRIAFRGQMLERIRAIPGVIAAANTRITPVSGMGWNDNISVDGVPGGRLLANFNSVGNGYFATVETPLLAGRDFGDADGPATPRVAIVTETFSRKFLNGSSPVGRTLGVAQQGGRPDVRYEIVGLVKDTKYTDLREEFTPIVFLAAGQDPEPNQNLNVVIRSDQPLGGVVSEVKGLLARTSPAIAVSFRVLETAIREGLLRERLMATLAGFFGFLAALLAMIGLYGVISYMVVRRRNEIGVRMALGADRGDVVALVLGEAGRLLGAGLSIGILLALLLGGAARAMLFGLRPHDPVTMGLAVFTLGAVALLASVLPARRAASLDPMEALRDE